MKLDIDNGSKVTEPDFAKNSGFPENRGKLVKTEVFRDFLGNYNRDFVHFASECRGERYRADAKDRSSKPFQEVEIFEVIRGFSALSEKFSEIRKIFFCIFDIYMLQFAKISNKKIFDFFPSMRSSWLKSKNFFFHRLKMVQFAKLSC